MGVGNRSAIGTLVERSSRSLILVHLPGGRTAVAVQDALTQVFTGLPPGLRRSLTWDQGKELSAHADLTRTLAMPVFFCQPHSPWQRGSNENMNGLLRDYFPKGTDLAVHPASASPKSPASSTTGPARPSGGTAPPASSHPTSPGTSASSLRELLHRSSRQCRRFAEPCTSADRQPWRRERELAASCCPDRGRATGTPGRRPERSQLSALASPGRRDPQRRVGSSWIVSSRVRRDPATAPVGPASWLCRSDVLQRLSRQRGAQDRLVGLSAAGSGRRLFDCHADRSCPSIQSPCAEAAGDSGGRVSEDLHGWGADAYRPLAVFLVHQLQKERLDHRRGVFWSREVPCHGDWPGRPGFAAPRHRPT